MTMRGIKLKRDVILRAWVKEGNACLFISFASTIITATGTTGRALVSAEQAYADGELRAATTWRSASLKRGEA